MTTGSTIARFTITLSKSVAEPVQVAWNTKDGTAKAGIDYAAASGTAVFSPGETNKDVDVLVYGRAVGTEDRNFFLEMTPPPNAILGESIGECIIYLDTAGNTAEIQVIVPTGPQGAKGDSAYQSWLNLGNTGTEQDFIDSLSPLVEEIAAEVAPILDISNSPLTAEGTETISKPDTMTGKRMARRVAYVGAAKVATGVLADGDNLITHADLSGDAVDFNSISLYPRILRGTAVISPEWSVELGDKILIKSAVAGDVLHVCQYDVISERAVRNAVAPVGSQAFEALRRGYAEAGLNVKGYTKDGVTLTSTSDVVIHSVSGKGYSWNGAYPEGGYFVTPETDPTLPGSGYVPRTDVMLRDDLSAPNGVDLVGGSFRQSDLVLQPITKIPSYNPSNVTQAWKDSVANYGYVYFPGFTSALATYNIAGDDPALHGTTVYVDDHVNLAFDWDYYPLIGSLKIHGNCKFSFISKNFSAYGGQVDYVRKSAVLNRNPLMMSAVPFSDCTQQTVNSDTWTRGSLGSNSASSILVPLTAGVTSGLFAPIAIGETISAHLKMETGTATSLGVMLRCANGWTKLHRVPNSPGAWTYQVKQIGQPIVTGATIPAPSNTLNSYSAGRASIGVSLTSRQTFRLVINGVAGYFPLSSLAGDIYEVGFFADGASSGAVALVTGLCSYKTADNKAHGAAPVNLAIYGDSTAEKWLSTFDMYLPQVMDGEMSCRSLEIRNFAVAGETFAQQFARLQANGPGQASIICMVAGTNEGQAGTSAEDFAAQVRQFIDYCYANGRTPMLVEPWMWYSNTFIGGVGQASANYDGASELREAGKRVAAGWAIYVSTTHELPAPLPEHFNSGLDPLLRDDIHQSELGYRLYAELIGSHIVEYLSRVDLAGRNVPFYWANQAVVTSIGAESKVTPHGLSVAINVNAFSNPSVVLDLPRGSRPDRPSVFTGMFEGTGGTYRACKVSYANGKVMVDGLTQGTSTIYIDAAW